MLTADEAAPIAGCPAEQLRRWAWDDWDVAFRRPRGLIGPRNSGTRHTPKFREDDLIAWRNAPRNDSGERLAS